MQLHVEAISLAFLIIMLLCQRNPQAFRMKPYYIILKCSLLFAKFVGNLYTMMINMDDSQNDCRTICKHICHACSLNQLRFSFSSVYDDTLATYIFVLKCSFKDNFLDTLSAQNTGGKTVLFIVSTVQTVSLSLFQCTWDFVCSTSQYDHSDSPCNGNQRVDTKDGQGT